MIQGQSMSPTASTGPSDIMHDPRLQPLREAAGEVIGSVFYETLLKMARNSPLRGEFGHGGYGERVFQGRLDAELAARAGKAGRNSLTAALVEHLADQHLRSQRATQPKGETP